MAQLRTITVDDIVTQIPAGQRDFSNTILKGNKDLSGHKGYEEMQSYLRGVQEDELRQNPVKINGSVLGYLIANELYMPFLKADRVELNQAKLRGANLSRAKLYRADLARADLRGAVLKKAELYTAILSRARLGGADLSEADLRGAVLSDANLTGADLSGADLREAVLREAVLSRVDLSRADLSGANLREAVLRGAQNLEKALDIYDANYYNTHISPEQEIILKAAFEKAGKKIKDYYFIVR